MLLEIKTAAIGKGHKYDYLCMMAGGGDFYFINLREYGRIQ